MYAWEQFHKATLALVKPGPIKQRLVTAYSDLKSVRPADLPEDVHVTFRKMSQELTRVTPFGDENPVCATVRKMSNDEASQWAANIVSMYDALSRSLSASNPLHPVVTNGHNGRNSKKHQFHIA